MTYNKELSTCKFIVDANKSKKCGVRCYGNYCEYHAKKVPADQLDMLIENKQRGMKKCKFISVNNKKCETLTRHIYCGQHFLPSHSRRRQIIDANVTFKIEYDVILEC